MDVLDTHVAFAQSAMPSSFRSVVPGIAFNKDAFSKCPKAMSHWAGSVSTHKGDVLKLSVQAQIRLSFAFAVPSSAALSAFALVMTGLSGTFHPAGVPRETSGFARIR